MSASSSSKTTEIMGASSSTSISDLTSFPYDLDACNQALAKLSDEFNAIKCRMPSCDATLTFGDAEQHIASWLTQAHNVPSTTQISEIKCHKCKGATCVGCGGPPVNSSLKNHIFTPLGVVSNCCSRAQLFGLYLLLLRFDQEELQRIKPATKPSKKKTKVPKGTGVGYAGAGSGADWDEWDEPIIPPDVWGGDLPGRSYSMKVVDYEEITPDMAMTSTLQLLVAFLPAAKRKSTKETAKEEVCLLRIGYLLDRVADLMRNGSIAEMTERYELYNAAFAFVEAIFRHVELSQLLFERRPEKKDSLGLNLPSKQARLPSKSPTSFSASIFAGMTESHREAQAFLKLNNTSAQMRDHNSYLGQNKDPVPLCKRFIDLYTDLAKSAPIVDMPDNSLLDLWTKFAEENRVTFTDEALKTHTWSSLFSTVKNSPPGRLSTIGKEIANMTTNLPAGIFLKVAESRSDVMKFLIVGPEGSPYTGGLFIFDMFLDGNYPASPPKVKFVLDDDMSGGFSFNPNLHPGGTVCLSLLNTWSGSPQEMWQPNKSTILSVLVSIQAMILGAPLPWVNEPGYNGQSETPQAHDHRLLVQCKTVRYAMLGWLDKPKAKGGIWSQISEEFWKHHALENLERVRGWAKSNDMLRKYDQRAQPHHAPFAHGGRPPKPSKAGTEDLLLKFEKAILEKFGIGGITANDPIVIDDDDDEIPAAKTSKGKGKKASKAKTSKAKKGEKKGVDFYDPYAPPTEEEKAIAQEFSAKLANAVDAQAEIDIMEAMFGGKGKAIKSGLGEASMADAATSTSSLKPKKGEKAASKSKAKAKAAGSKRRKEDDEDIDEDDMSAPPAKKSRRSSRKKASSYDDDTVDEDEDVPAFEVHNVKKKKGASLNNADSDLHQGKHQHQSQPQSKHLDAKHQSTQPPLGSDIGGQQSQWVYTGGKAQKEIRAACKEFGISYASTIKESVEKLERYVNEKGKVGGELVEKFGEMRMV